MNQGNTSRGKISYQTFMSLHPPIIAGTWFASCSSTEMTPAGRESHTESSGRTYLHTPDQYHLQQIAEDATVHMLGWSPDRLQQIVVANALPGQALISGQLQVSIPPLYLIGDGLTIDLRSSE